MAATTDGCLLSAASGSSVASMATKTRRHEEECSLEREAFTQGPSDALEEQPGAARTVKPLIGLDETNCLLRVFVPSWPNHAAGHPYAAQRSRSTAQLVRRSVQRRRASLG